MNTSQASPATPRPAQPTNHQQQAAPQTSQHLQQAKQLQQQAQELEQMQQEQIKQQQAQVQATAAVKSEPAASVVTKTEVANEDVKMIEDSLLDENGKLQYKKIFIKRKKTSVRAREKKIRQNRQLRKVMLPKNALMALNEIKGVIISDFVINNNVGGGFTAVVTVNEVQYEGRGSSKVSAKSNACEKALRDYVIKKMMQKPRIVKSEAGSAEAMDTSENNVESDGGESEKGTTNNATEEDDVPMINLASFALYKLFAEWENEGFVVPEMHPSATSSTNSTSENGSGSATPKEPKPVPVRKELPPNWEAMHPATLLCVMRPGLTYTDLGSVGDPPNVIHGVSIIVDENEFTGKGRSKKIARRNAAVSVCNEIFGTNFVKDEPSEYPVVQM